MFGVMRELVHNNYSRLLNPEHPRALEYDRERPGFKTYYPEAADMLPMHLMSDTRGRCCRPPSHSFGL